MLDDLLLLASEIVTNVVRHAGTDAELGLDLCPTGVKLWCRDHCPALPERRHAGPHDEDGRGLHLLGALATSWGFERLAGDGKVVWVYINQPSTAT